jgi:hypothetical protein
MKTLAWTPAQDELSTEFSIDDEVIFASTAVKVDKRVSLMNAILTAAGYAARGLSFEIRSITQDTLAVFEPGLPVKGYRSIVRALTDAAAHIDYHTTEIAQGVAARAKFDAARVYEQGVIAGALAAKRRFEETGDFGLDQEPGADAQATAPAESGEAPASDA